MGACDSMTKAKNNNKAANKHFGILLNPDTILDIENLEKERISDQFGFKKKIPGFVRYMKEYLGNKKSLVVGIYGGYGSGKSVFVNLVKDKVEKEKNSKTKFIVFHAWKYKDEQSIWRNFVLKILSDFESKKLYRKEEEFKKQKVNLEKKLYNSEEKNQSNDKEINNSLIVLGLILTVLFTLIFLTITGLSLINNTGPISNIFVLTFSIISAVFLIFEYHSTKQTRQPMFSIEEFEEKFRALIDNCRYDKLYIAIENIDRCLPKDSIRLLESLKAFLEDTDKGLQSENKLIFLVPCDKDLLEIAIQKEYDNKDINASSYLDKIIQLPYDLPVCSNNHWMLYVKSLLNTQLVICRLSFEHHKTNEIEDKAFSEWIIDMLNRTQITNPREVKVLLREWEMRFVNLPDELKNNEEMSLKSALILLKLLILKKKYPDVYVIYLNIVSKAENFIDNAIDKDDLLNILFESESVKDLDGYLWEKYAEKHKDEMNQIRAALYKINETYDPQKEEKTTKLRNVIEPGLHFMTFGYIKPPSFEDFKKFMLTTKSSKKYGAKIMSYEFKTGSTENSANSDDKKAVK